MKSYKMLLCAVVLTAFLTVGLGGCCSTMCPGGCFFGSNEPERQGPQTMEEFMNQPRPGVNLTPADQ